ncbi:MAG TPA: hypothetical protein VNK52_00695 [Hyphomicrobiaceae bacterium]|nr:hypothetical protein [Hyphomicrobiaceae bacterium]
MLWFYVGAAALGLLLGLVFRAGAVIAASVVLAAASVVLGPLLAGTSIWLALAVAFGGTFALQMGYFTGLLLICALSRVEWADARERLLGGYRSFVARASRVWTS